MMELVKITQLSQQTGLSSRTLRYYEQVGLIQSIRPDHEKYRFYAQDAVERLQQIIVLRKLQIPIKDILRIYQSKDMGVIVEAFVRRMQAIEEEVVALSELRRIINEFLQTMIRNGITQISALPFLYEEMDRQLKNAEAKNELTYERLSAVSEKLQRISDVRIVELPPMRVITSLLVGGASDPEGFWDWLNDRQIAAAAPGQHALFEYQNSEMQTVLMRRWDEAFAGNCPYTQAEFSGGLFAVSGVYLDDDLGAALRGMIRYFDDNPYYEADYLHHGTLRHEPLVETVLSPDAQREKVDLFLPVKNRAPNVGLFGRMEQAEPVSPLEIERENPALWVQNVAMDQFRPILAPHYRVTEAGEAEYIAYIDKRLLSTEVSVKIPFRVDIEFKVDTGNDLFAYGSDEGSIRFYHNGNMYGVNMENNSESGLSKQAIYFQQPIFREPVVFPGLGKINAGVYNSLTWIVGEKHFAVLLNGETRYCGVNFPYMQMDLRLQKAYPVLIGSNGSGKRYFRKVCVSQLKLGMKAKIKEGELAMVTRQSNNRLPVIHPVVTLHYGENYWFNGCAKYVMECLNEPDYDYWLFSALTGDNLVQVYTRDDFWGDSATDYQVGGEEKGGFIERVFAKCGYASTYVAQKSIAANPEMYLQTLMAYIDRGIPVIRYFYTWGVFVGYEDYGKTLLYMTADQTEPERVPVEALFTPPDRFATAADSWVERMGFGWCFVGNKKHEPELRDLYRDVILDMPRLLSVDTGAYCFGAAAFRAWADEVDRGRFVGMSADQFDDWAMYKIYVCNVATNAAAARFWSARWRKTRNCRLLRISSANTGGLPFCGTAAGETKP